MLIYCLKCRAKTDMKNLKDGVTKTTRAVKTGNYAVYNTKKSVFVKMDKDTSIPKPPEKPNK